MKITDVDVFRMSTPVHKAAGTNWMFVRITTDTGDYGWGEASTQYKDAGVAAEIGEFAKYLEGKDPFQIEHIWTSLYRRVTWTGGAVSMSAISGIDLALNDLKAKALGIPVYELLGGKVRDDIRAYANGWFDPTEDDAVPVRELTPDDFARRTAELVDEGWRAMKFYPFAGPQVIDPERLERGVALVKAVRESVGGVGRGRGRCSWEVGYLERTAGGAIDRGVQPCVVGGADSVGQRRRFGGAGTGHQYPDFDG